MKRDFTITTVKFTIHGNRHHNATTLADLFTWIHPNIADSTSESFQKIIGIL